MAMALLDAGLSCERFSIDAVDISERAIEQARGGIYGRNSFRGQDLAFRDHYFEPVAGGHRVNDAVRLRVRFRQDNVLEAGFLAGEAQYDAIFCRNLLIYFDKADQDRTICRLRRMLTDDGLLFVGPAESNIVLDHGMVSAKVRFAFAFHKDAAGSPARRRAPLPAASGPPSASSSLMGLAPMQLPSMLSADAPDLLGEALALANQGRLSDAGILCEEQMRQHGPSPALFHLMGLISSASGKTTAADRFYRKALYLDQNHQPTLIHLSLLLEQQGDERGAKLLRKRAQRQQASG
jgi:chemotaxis protein methyltransferase WspC